MSDSIIQAASVILDIDEPITSNPFAFDSLSKSISDIVYLIENGTFEEKMKARKAYREKSKMYNELFNSQQGKLDGDVGYVTIYREEY